MIINFNSDEQTANTCRVQMQVPRIHSKILYYDLKPLVLLFSKSFTQNFKGNKNSGNLSKGCG